jgi:hypothetical protein
MSPQARKRFLIGLAALCVLLFIGGAFAWVLDFRHHTVCGAGVQWVQRSEDPMGQTTYVCPNGTTVTQGMLP